jgi:hypothetical protein
MSWVRVDPDMFCSTLRSIIDGTAEFLSFSMNPVNVLNGIYGTEMRVSSDLVAIAAYRVCGFIDKLRLEQI